MSLPLLALAVLVVLALGYRLYGGFVARQYALDDTQKTPAHQHEDGVDFVPTGRFYLFSQHFSAIAAAGPIAGPILAVQQFGWAPALAWIVVGVVFIGAVHDFSTLVASVRHGGQSIAEVVRQNLGERAAFALLIFIWVALIYVVVAFVDVTSSTFVSGDAELKGFDFRFNPGGAVAFSSVTYLGLAIVMGLVQRFLRPPLWLVTLVFVPATLALIWGGTQISTLFMLDARTWAMIILAYCFVASLTPVWVLLQPRGYLGGFVLYAALAAGVIGIFFGGFTIEQPAFKGWESPGGALFPFLFVTIACGACSGFHGLVCSGTTSKQIDRETHCHAVGYGAMLLEGFVAVIALATIMIALPADIAGKGPGAVYGMGLGRFLTTFLGEDMAAFALTFGAMAFSTFVFDTLDVTTRLGRYILQELVGRRLPWMHTRGGALLATAITCGVPLAFVFLAPSGSYRLFWTLFGTSNQLLAALSLLGITIWLRRQGRRHAYTLWPMLFVMAVTLTALVQQVWQGVNGTTTVAWINGGVSVLLLGLTAVLGVEAVKAWRRPGGSQ
jgi:carbon starvation protein